MTKQEFLKDVDNFSNHRHLLWHALEATNQPGNDHPVLELGCGDGSTPFLKKYCQDNRRVLKSYDSNPEWAKKHKSIYLPDWDHNAWFYKKQYSVVLIDEAPGEHRKIALELFCSFPIHFQIIVLHDSEPPGQNSSDYQVRPLFSGFQYVKDFVTPKPGAWATALSNTIDVTKFEV